MPLLIFFRSLLAISFSYISLADSPALRLGCFEDLTLTVGMLLPSFFESDARTCFSASSQEALPLAISYLQTLASELLLGWEKGGADTDKKSTRELVEGNILTYLEAKHQSMPFAFPSSQNQPPERPSEAHLQE